MTILQVKLTKYNFQYFAEQRGYEIIPEFRFSKKRRFRNDWKVSKNGKSCGIEYEGMKRKKGKSRHTTLVGYSDDCEKYNLAALEGWTILRYTCKNFDNVLKDLDIFFGLYG